MTVETFPIRFSIESRRLKIVLRCDSVVPSTIAVEKIGIVIFGNQLHMNKAITDAGLVVLRTSFLSSDIFMVTAEQLRLLGMYLPRGHKRGPATTRGGGPMLFTNC
jgi:hypothetical protein